jgi:hypothetical protein
MPAKSALDRLDQIIAEHPHSPGSQRVTLTLGEVRDLKSRIDRLTAEHEAAAETGGG